ncbi:MAG: transposase [Planctomycetota bacterium]|nr:transposase [Planctomycetota bacterium]
MQVGVAAVASVPSEADHASVAGGENRDVAEADAASAEAGDAIGGERDERVLSKVLAVEPALWTFATVRGIEPTNNHAERMLWPAVMWRKQSLGSHSVRGCRFVERMMTAVQTLKLRGRSVMDYLEQAVHALRCGRSPPPLSA